MRTKAELRALEKLFAAGIERRLPFCSKAKIYDKLEGMGLVERFERRFVDRFGAMIVRGWALTHLGRYTYCASCKGDK